LRIGSAVSGRHSHFLPPRGFNQPPKHQNQSTHITTAKKNKQKQDSMGKWVTQPPTNDEWDNPSIQSSSKLNLRVDPDRESQYSDAQMFNHAQNYPSTTI